ncbi:MAG TPA: glycosyltransferase family 2 protein [Armatimonadota bacterium]|jgi:dolichol-phosphate mannosyltransferase
MKFSVVMPARNEEGSLEETLHALVAELRAAEIPSEIIVVDDGSTDDTAARVHAFGAANPEVRLVPNRGRNGFGMAVRTGLAEMTGDAVAIMMADGSDRPADAIRYYHILAQGRYDCVFGSRFLHDSHLVDYPVHKLLMNRLANWFIKVLFGYRFNDTTNAFKAYRREVIDGIQPLISPHFNLTVEMPLKAIVRGYSYLVIPIWWVNRKAGISKLKIREMGSRYLFIILYLWLEKTLARGDYHRRQHAGEARADCAPLKCCPGPASESQAGRPRECTAGRPGDTVQ